jgi:hypothetical protein
MQRECDIPGFSDNHSDRKRKAADARPGGVLLLLLLLLLLRSHTSSKYDRHATADSSRSFSTNVRPWPAQEVLQYETGWEFCFSPASSEAALPSLIPTNACRSSDGDAKNIEQLRRDLRDALQYSQTHWHDGLRIRGKRRFCDETGFSLKQRLLMFSRSK